MKIIVGSTNKIKIEAVQETITQYPLLNMTMVTGKNVPSQVADQPKSLHEAVQGAINRAKNAFEEGSYSFGLESGLMAVPFTKTGFMDVCVCAIYDGKTIHLGLSQAFECPPEVVRLVHEKGYDLNQFECHWFNHQPATGSCRRYYWHPHQRASHQKRLYKRSD